MNTHTPSHELNPGLFSACWHGLGARHDDAFDELATRYDESHRAYHTAEHIAECLGWWERIRPLAHGPLELAIAIYFHDVVYDPARADNEDRSAALCAGLARQAGIDEATIGRIEALVQHTRQHDAMEGDAALLSDLDLAVLGASPARYSRYERAIRQEYLAVDEATYRAARARVLSGFLSRWAIYRTEPLASLLERQARINLGCAIDALTRDNRHQDGESSGIAQPRRTACFSS